MKRKYYSKKPSVSREAIESEALGNAVNGQSLANYTAIFEGFMARGIPESEIKPRENVFTYNAWRALGRQVRKGEHGIKILTFITCDPSEETRAKDPDAKGYRRPWSTTVFHETQTDLIGQQPAAMPAADPIAQFRSAAETWLQAMPTPELEEITTDLDLENAAGEVL